VDGETTVSIRARGFKPAEVLTDWRSGAQRAPGGELIQMSVQDEESCRPSTATWSAAMWKSFDCAAAPVAGRPVHPGGRHGRRLMNTILVIARLTYREAIRRKLCWLRWSWGWPSC
jgi:hypothetical protein